MLRTTALCLAFTLIPPLAVQAQGQEFPFTLRASGAQGKIEMRLSRDDSRRNSDNRTWNLEDLEGLTPPVFSGQGELRFRIARPAGTMACAGRKDDGRAEGDCRFSRDAGYFAALERYGVHVRDDWESWQLAAFDVKLSVLEELRRQGYRTPTVGGLVASAIFQIDVEFLRALDAAGYRQQTVDALVPFRIHKITPDYIRDIRAANPRLKLESSDLVALSIHRVTPDWVAGWTKLGYDLDAKQLTNTRIHNVSPDYARSMMAEVRDKPTIDQFIAMRIHGARPGR